MIEKKQQIFNKLGLHARAAAKLSHLANMFSADIYLIYNEDKVNAKSLLGILTLAASVGNEITLQAAGEDEQEASRPSATSSTASSTKRAEWSASRARPSRPGSSWARPCSTISPAKWSAAETIGPRRWNGRSGAWTTP